MTLTASAHPGEILGGFFFIHYFYAIICIMLNRLHNIILSQKTPFYLTTTDFSPGFFLLNYLFVKKYIKIISFCQVSFSQIV